MRIVRVLVLLCGIGGLLGAEDKWEISGVGGGSFYRNVEARGNNPPHIAKVGFFNGVAVGAVLSQTGRQHWGGEFHYLFQTNNMRLRAGQGASSAADFSAQSHSFHYDVVLYAARREARIRPFIAAGPGLKVYSAAGQPRAFQPLGDIVVFSRESVVKFLVSGGGGVKFRIAKNALFRLDFRDYVTGIPKNFTALPGVRISGQFHNFVGTAGLGIFF